MTVNLNDLRRPAPMAAAAVAVVGWILAGYLFASSASKEARQDNQIHQLQTQNQQLDAELKLLHEASGDLAAIRTKAAAAQSALDAANRTHDQVQTQLVETTKELESVKQVHAQTKSQADDAAKRLAASRDLTKQVEARLNAARADLGGIEQSIVQRSQDLDEVGKKLKDTRQQDSVTRAAEAHVQEQLSDARDALKLAIEQRGQIEKAIADGSANRDHVAEEVVNAQEHYAELQQQLALTTELITQRNRDLSELDEQLQKARAELGEVQRQLAIERQNLANSPASVGSPR